MRVLQSTMTGKPKTYLVQKRLVVGVLTGTDEVLLAEVVVEVVLVLVAKVVGTVRVGVVMVGNPMEMVVTVYGKPGIEIVGTGTPGRTVTVMTGRADEVVLVELAFEVVDGAADVVLAFEVVVGAAEEVVDGAADVVLDFEVVDGAADVVDGATELLDEEETAEFLTAVSTPELADAVVRLLFK